MSALVLRGDARSLPLPDASVDLIVTSPPFWGQRDYQDGGQSLAGQIGSEETPGEWLEALWDCTREWMRVLKPSGSLFVELGDKYSQRVQVRRSSHQPGIFPGKFGEFAEPWAERATKGAVRMPQQSVMEAGSGRYVPEKSLLALPWRYAIGCVDRLGLILRRDIVWSKTSALPESVTDRCASRHEYLFHLVKQSRYYSAVDEIREPHSPTTHPGRTRSVGNKSGNGVTHRTFAGNTDQFNALGKLPGSVWEMGTTPLVVPAHLGLEDHFAAFPFELPRRCILGWSPPAVCLECGEGRFPVVQASRLLDGAPVDGTWQTEVNGHALGPQGVGHWRYATDRRILGYACVCTPYTDHEAVGRTATRRDRVPPATRPQGTYGRKQAGEYERVGPWREYHLDRWNAPPARPAVVADPFGGTGTTALVADVLGRHGISFDLSAGYCRTARWRTTDPGERARAMQVPKPPPVPDGQGSLFDGEAVS